MKIPPTPRRAVRPVLAFILLATAGACSKSDGGTAPVQPASVSASSTAGLTATVGTALDTPTAFTVKDAGGNALGNVTVTVVVSGGGGSLVGAPTRTLAGATPVGTWTLGTTAGVNSLTVTISGLAPLVITATGTPGAPTKIIASGNAQTALAGALVATPLGVTLQDQFGNGVPNVPVTFLATAGGGSVAPGLLTTNASGVASGAGWRLGNKGGTQAASATASGLTSSFSANIQSSYPLDLRFFGPAMSAEAQTAFVNAAARLRAAIISQLSSVPLNGTDLSQCGVNGLTGTLTETSQGVIVYAAVAAIDGPGKVLAQAGPCFIRNTSKLPVVGVMEFDSADIQNYITSGRFEAVVLHEMNHVLGLGTIWDDKSLLTGAGTTNPRFTGSTSIANCATVGGLATHCAVGTGVAVENTGGPGTADGHWRESLFDSELMTGFVESTPNMPWSIMSIGSFQDLGYSVNALAADSYSVPSLLTMARLSKLSAASAVEGPWETVRRPKFEVGPTGRVTALKEIPK